MGVCWKMSNQTFNFGEYKEADDLNSDYGNKSVKQGPPPVGHMEFRHWCGLYTAKSKEFMIPTQSFSSQIKEAYRCMMKEFKQKKRHDRFLMLHEFVIESHFKYYFSKEYTSLSLKSIGYHFGGRDHSTVIHAVQCVNDMIDIDTHFKNSIENLRKKLKMNVAVSP